MNQQKPRDNSMYHLSDRTNLKQLDKALKSYTNKFGVFGHKMLTKSQIQDAKSFRYRSEFNGSRRSKESSMQEIWQSFTVPVKFRIPSRRKSKATRASTVTASVSGA